MPYTDFHYTPTGTGVISGKEVLEQTEDAINDLGTQISGDVQTAIDTANNALNTANTASTDAQNAVNTANTAYTTATNAQNTANAAQTTATNALTAAQNAQNDVNALGNRVTTAEGNITQNTNAITGLTTRMGTAEGNITTLQNDVITAQGTATSAQNTATMARQQAYVLRYSSTAITDNSTIAYSTLDNTDNIKASDKIIDTDGKIFSIVSVDSDNSTVTVGSALIDLALDANVVHTSGDETVGGQKVFNDINAISSSAEIGVSAGNNSFKILDKNKKTLLRLEGGTFSGGMAYGYLLVNNGSDVFNGVSLYQSSANSAQLRPYSSTLSLQLGASNRYFSDCYTSKINGLTPSSLGMPSDRSARIDISGYFTNTASGDTNTYTVPVNGWIYLNLNDVVVAHCFAQIAGNLSHYGQTFARASAGQLHCLFPVRKDDVFVSQWYTTTTVTVTNAYFIPCQGNI